jgi:hypothetical protein
MIRVFVKQGRGLLVLVALLAIAVAACSSGGPQIPGSTGTGNGGTGNGGTGQPGAGGFASGLASNLDALNSYKFSWSVLAVDAADTAAPSGSGSTAAISGTVINKPTKASSVNFMGAQYITIGSEQWISTDDGATWIANPSPADLSSMLPDANYASYFDAYDQAYKQVGTEKKNGVDAIHFQGDLSALTGLLGKYGGIADMKADLWIAKSGNYPVSGSFSYKYAVGTSGGSLGYTFDITNVNDSSNKVEKPANVTELPS